MCQSLAKDCTLNLNDDIFHLFWVDIEIQFRSRSMSDPILSDIDFKNEIAWVWSPDSGLPLNNFNLPMHDFQDVYISYQLHMNSTV